MVACLALLNEMYGLMVHFELCMREEATHGDSRDCC